MRGLSLLSIASLAVTAYGAAFSASHNVTRSLIRRDTTPATWDQLLQAQLTAVTLSYNNPVWTNGINAILASLQSLVDESQNILFTVTFVPDPSNSGYAEWNNVQDGYFDPVGAVSGDGQTLSELCQQYTDSFLSSSLLSTPAETYLQVLNSLKSNLTAGAASMRSPAAFSTFNQTVLSAIQIYDNYFATQEAAIDNEISQIQADINIVRHNIEIDNTNIALGNADAGLLGFDRIAAVAVFGEEGEAFGDLVQAVYEKAGIDGDSIVQSASGQLAQDQGDLNSYQSSLKVAQSEAAELAYEKSLIDSYIYYVQDSANLAGSFSSFYNALLTVTDGLIAMVESGVLQNGDYWAPNPGPPVEWVTYRETGLNLHQTSCATFGQIFLNY